MTRLPKMLADIASAAVKAVSGDRRRARRSPASGPPSAAPVRSVGNNQPSPGSAGPQATVEVDPHAVGQTRMTYAPDPDGAPDPGEVVWTWVPFEENDGRGKDRPVLLVAAEPSGAALGVQLTSKQHAGADYVGVGTGAWDREDRPSWANLDRVIRVYPAGMRREGTALGHQEFDVVTQRLAHRYGWSNATGRASTRNAGS